MSEEGTFEPCWAIVELFGHQKIAGEVSEQVIAGRSFLQVDVPEMDGENGFTRFYGSSAIYSITPVSEQVARLAVKRIAVKPVMIYMPEITLQLQLPEPNWEEDEDDEYC